MKIRIKFRKYGVMKFIGHLDIMRYFQKAMRRADIDACYSEGFSPHMVMSFAAPLGVGLTSDGEYLDMEVGNEMSSADAVRRLNAVMAEGMEVLSFREISDEKSQKAMSLVAAADYEVAFREGHEPAIDWKSSFETFKNLGEILIVKKTKKSEREVDIKPMIYNLRLEENCIFMQLATGSVNNLKPELVMEAFAQYAGFELPEFSLCVNRKEVYADLGTENAKNLVALETLGKEF